MRPVLANRSLIPHAERVVIKVGSSSLTMADGTLNRERVRTIAAILSHCYHRGQRPVLVSSGAVAAGVGILGLSGRPTDTAGQQACAMVGQSGLMAAYAEEFDHFGISIGQALLTADDVMKRSQYANVTAALNRLLDLGTIPILNENDAVTSQALRLGDNDRLAALATHIVDADVMVLLTDVDGLYTAPPGEPGAMRIDTVSDTSDLDGLKITGRGTLLGTGGMSTKVIAARMVSTFGVPTVITSAENLGPALEGDDVGTWFAATGPRSAARDRWIVHAARISGTVTIDDGAEVALKRGGASLLAVGITDMSGTFRIGDGIEIRNTAGELIARGLSGWDSDELQSVLGRSGVGRPVVHIDDLVLSRQ